MNPNESCIREYIEGWWPIGPCTFMQPVPPHVHIELRPYDGKVYLAGIAVLELEYRGQGHASAALERLKDLATKHQVSIFLSIKPFPIGRKELWGMNKVQLKAWYKRHGFRQGKYSWGHMEWTPPTKE